MVSEERLKNVIISLLNKKHLGYQLNFKNEHKIETNMFSTLNKNSHPERQTTKYGGQVYNSKIDEE